jgi:hypothetical protein
MDLARPGARASAPVSGRGSRVWWQRKRVLIPTGLFLLLLIVGALSGDPKKPTQTDRAGSLGTVAKTATPTATVDRTARARAEAAKLRHREGARSRPRTRATGTHRPR